MLLFIEIGLSYWALKRGWGKFSIVPLVCGLSLGFTLGLVANALNLGVDAVIPLSLSMEGLLIMSLVAMIWFGKKPFGKPELTDEKQRNWEASCSSNA
ncbi:MAG: hypothetical protein P8K79_04830 [Mariniblastus sp.]|nr:hypothetical protein [Mariniblastus sp.]